MTQADILISKVLLLATGIVFLAYLFRISLKGRAHSDRIERHGGSMLLSKSVMEMGCWAMQPFCRLAIRSGVSANAISYSAVLFGAIAGICLAWGRIGLAAAFGLLGGALDAMDGMVARASGTMSHAGKILDSALDRYVEFFLFAGLIAYFHPTPWAQGLALGALVGSFMVSYSTALAEIVQVTLPRGPMQRPERLVYLILGFTFTPLMVVSPLAYPILFSLALIASIANLSAILRIRYIRKSVDEREQRRISLTLAQVRSVRSPPRTPPRFGTG